MALMKGSQPAEEQMYDMTHKKKGGVKLVGLKAIRMYVRLCCGGSAVAAAGLGLFAILGNKISGNPFIPYTLFFGVVAVVFFFILQRVERKISEYE